MDLRISADSDIKRLREMVQKLEEKNAALKTPESPRLVREPSSSSPVTKYRSDKMSSSPVLERVAVRLHLDDVPLMDLSDVDSEEEDSWLYMSPVHPPTPAQKSLSPYKYLKQSIDHQNDLNKVRGSLMAKLESIAAQEESLARHDRSDSPPKHTHSSDMNSTFIVDERSRRNDYNDEFESLEISGSETYPFRRRSAPMKPPQTKLYKPWENLVIGDDDDDDDNPPYEAPVVRRRSAKPIAPRGHSPRSHDDIDSGVIGPRGRSSQSFTMETPGSDEENFDSAPVVRRRGMTPPVNPAVLPSDDIPAVSKVRPRGQTSQSFAVSAPSDDDDDDNSEYDAPVVRRRGVRSSTGSPQLAWQGENDDDNLGPVRPRRRGTPKNDDDDADFDSQGPSQVIRRRGPPSPRPSDDGLVVTAVRRRGAQQDSQIRPRGSGLPSPQQGGIPMPTKRSTPPRLRVSQETEAKRRSLPQVPSDSMIHPRVSGASTPPRIRSNSPAGGVVPRGSKLAQPRRIPTPRAASSYYAAESDQNWQDGCY